MYPKPQEGDKAVGILGYRAKDGDLMGFEGE